MVFFVMRCLPFALLALAAVALSSGCTMTGGAETLRRPELCRTGAAVEVAWPRRLYSAVVVHDLDDSGMCLVRYEGTERRWSERVAPSRIYGQEGGGGAALCEAGERIWVDWAGAQWYAAEVRGDPDSDGHCPVHYVEYEDAWDEAVSLERLRAGKD